ncbi:MAG: hypothetical protein AAFX10_07790 [Pseudomonadota bacterium]
MTLHTGRGLLLAAGCLLLAACGGGGGDAAPPDSGAPPVNTPQPNRAPTAEAGEPQSAQAGGVVLLNGVGVDADGDSLTYAWEQVDGPEVDLQDTDSAVARFDVPPTFSALSLTFLLTVTDPDGVIATDTTTVWLNLGFTSCTPTAPPEELGLDAFYTKYCDANGIPIVSSGNVADEALEWARYIVLEMVKLRPDVVGEMISNDARVGMIAENELVTDMPEYEDLYILFPDVDWNIYRGLGAVIGRPLGSSSEENTLCLPGDVYEGSNILVHEFAHTIDNLGLKPSDSSWRGRLNAAYQTAMDTGLWQDCAFECYAATNSDEYFAEGSQQFFNVAWDSTESPLHNDVDTREELAAYDPALYQLLLEVYAEIEIPLCPVYAAP